ncbi:MAG: hypothetical protein JO092_02075 [Candidatus Eremiobacteraeota bacterium]|nr:hypothetical protein [Candidatus Eremiobacteraeota bacterium]
MNHAWHNAGHDSIVTLVEGLASDLAPDLSRAGVALRLISFDVRNRMVLPAAPQGTALFIGTGGPGHLNPRFNRRDAVDEGEIHESGDWEEPLFALFDAIDENDRAMLYGVCHSFGLLCRWSGAANPVLRATEKGGPSIGIVENVLTPQALEHPWFARLASHLPDGRHMPVVDSRHYDLVPRRAKFRRGITPIAFEADPSHGEPGCALTMCEFARKPNGVPRIFAANHHPEIPNAAVLAALLERKLAQGEVTPQWYAGRAQLVTRLQRSDHSEPARLLAAGYSFGFLVRDGLRELIEDRRKRRGRTISGAL